MILHSESSTHTIVVKESLCQTDDEEEESTEENKYSFLANEEEFSAEGIDFSDPAALLKR